MAKTHINQKKTTGIYLFVFFVAVISDSFAKTVLIGNTKKPCTKSHGNKNKNAPFTMKITQLVTSLPTTLPLKTKTPCTKKHDHRTHAGEKSTTLSSYKSTLPTQKAQIKRSTQALTTTCRPIDCVVSKWNMWKPCSATCGISGRKHRYRKIATFPLCGGVCPYVLQERTTCNRICFNGGKVDKQGCKCRSGYNGVCCEKVNGHWSPWGEWSLCSKSCDTGIQRRIRTCDNPAPSGGGLYCAGPSVETIDCNKQACPVNGGWSAWGDWSTCSSSCGEGKKFRQRQCNNPFPSNGGLPCIGLMMLTAKCQLEECRNPVDGGWSQWLEWSQCSKTCGRGTRMRTRVCNNPLPSNGGSSCSGLSQEEEMCLEVKCKVPGNGGSGAEGGFGKRHSKHDATTNHRDKRSLPNSLFVNGPRRRILSYEDSNIIPNFDVFVQNHKEESMKRDDKTIISGPWTSWSSCSTSCGDGQRFRTRACRDLADPCIGVPMDVQSCNMGKCTS